jgi:hypothetical protein
VLDEAEVVVHPKQQEDRFLQAVVLVVQLQDGQRVQ